MSYRISQDPEQMKLAASLQQKCDILAIRLIESTASCKSAIGDDNGLPFSFAAEFQPEAAECDGDSLSVTTRFSFKIISGKDKTEMIVLHCLIGAEYTLVDEFQPSVEQIKAFKEGPAIFNCWPYFREYVQNTVVRMNYPPPAIPFLWLEVKKPTTPQPEQAAESSTQPSEPKKTLRKPRRTSKHPEGA